jgi:CDP-glucose 4,6-dehydratase
MALNSLVWNGKKVIVTGHTGFKGSWLCLLLRELGAEVIGLSLPPDEPRSLYSDANIGRFVENEFFCDIRNLEKIDIAFQECKPDYVFHLAAQAMVHKSVQNPIDTFTTNAIGTANLLSVLLKSDSVIGSTIVTTDKVYENSGLSIPFIETDKLGGRDPYSASKAAAEIFTSALNFSNNPRGIPVTTVRAGNLIGGGDWGKDRLIPDIIRSFNANEKLEIRNPSATRPWQHVLDCLTGYLLLGQAHMSGNQNISKALNFGPRTSMSVLDLMQHFETAFGRKIDYQLKESEIVEHQWLNLNSSLAYAQLGWQPFYSQVEAIQKTAEWYSKFSDGIGAYELVQAEMLEYKTNCW